jgi:hypothetical protein
MKTTATICEFHPNAHPERDQLIFFHIEKKNNPIQLSIHKTATKHPLNGLTSYKKELQHLQLQQRGGRLQASAGTPPSLYWSSTTMCQLQLSSYNCLLTSGP